MQEIALKYIWKIGAALTRVKPKSNSLFNGNGALLLYYTELLKTTENREYKPIADGLFSAISGNSSAGIPMLSGYSLHSGIAGYEIIKTWMDQAGYTIKNNSYNTGNVDSQLTHFAFNLLDINASDYLTGAYGIIQCLLSKKQTSDIKFQVSRILEKIIDHYNRYGIYSCFGNSAVYPEGNSEINLGLCFGLSGNLLLLIKAAQLNYCNNNGQLTTLIKKCTQFILSYKMDVDYSDQFYSFFPATAKKEGNYIDSSARLAWFNSDLNHALLFYQVAELTNEPSYKKLADYIGLQTIQRKKSEETMLTDSSFFKGSAGIAQLCKKLSTYSKSEDYLRAYEYWIEQTILMLEDELQSNYYQGNEADLLHGLTGIALVLLDYIFNSNAKWKDLLFV